MQQIQKSPNVIQLINIQLITTLYEVIYSIYKLQGQGCNGPLMGSKNITAKQTDKQIEKVISEDPISSGMDDTARKAYQ